jgi:dihydrofolate reductase
MPKISAYEQVSVDGFFATEDNDISWSHREPMPEELRRWVTENASGADVVAFGRRTYEMMQAFWPTPAAAKQFPEVAKHMNAATKIVFSRTLESVSWSGARIARDLPGEIRKLKAEAKHDVTVLGSGTVVSELVRLGLLDELQLLVFPVVLGRGRSLFPTVARESPLHLTLTSSRTFPNGAVYLRYSPAR